LADFIAQRGQVAGAQRFFSGPGQRRGDTVEPGFAALDNLLKLDAQTVLLVGQRRQETDCDENNDTEQDRRLARQLPQQHRPGTVDAFGKRLAANPQIGNAVAHDIRNCLAHRNAVAIQLEMRQWPGFAELDYVVILQPSCINANAIHP
jgi:hypothetical protein